MRYESHDEINLKVDDIVLKPKQTAEDFGQRISISVGESNVRHCTTSQEPFKASIIL